MDDKMILDIFNSCFSRGYVLGSELSRDNFSMSCDREVSELEFRHVEEVICNNGLQLNGSQYYPFSVIVNEEQCCELVTYLQKIQNGGHSKIDLLKVYDDLYDDLFIYTKLDRDHYHLLRNILDHYCPHSYVFQNNSVIFSEKSNENEIVSVLKNAGYPLSISEIKSNVMTMADSDIDSIFWSRDIKKMDILKVDPHHFTHIDCLNLDIYFHEAFLQVASSLDLDNNQIDAEKFYSVFDAALGGNNALDSNYQISTPMFLMTVVNHLHPEYVIRGGYIGKASISSSLQDRVMAEFRQYDLFTDEIYDAIMRKYHRQQWAYLDLLLKEYVRVSEKEFVRKDKVCFPTAEIDEALSRFLLPGYCSVLNISTFADFPAINIIWNRYVLVSYLCSAPTKYRFDYAGGRVPSNFVGVIHSKTDSLAFDDICAKYLVDCGLSMDELDNENVVGDHLKRSGFLTRVRKGQYLSQIIMKAKTLRVEQDV